MRGDNIYFLLRNKKNYLRIILNAPSYLEPRDCYISVYILVLLSLKSSDQMIYFEISEVCGNRS